MASIQPTPVIPDQTAHVDLAEFGALLELKFEPKSQPQSCDTVASGEAAHWPFRHTIALAILLSVGLWGAIGYFAASLF